MTTERTAAHGTRNDPAGAGGMDSDERTAWRDAVRLANRYGHEGKRVVFVDVSCPTTAASRYESIFILDNGPRTATENW